MRAWFFDENVPNAREKCVLAGSPEIGSNKFEKLKIKLIKFNAAQYEEDASYQEFKANHDYNYQGSISENLRKKL